MNFEQNSGIVFVGEFPSVFIDERELFGGRVDRESSTRLRQTLQCTFAGGQHELSANTGQISVTSLSNTTMPGDLIESAELIATKIDALAPVVKISGIGFINNGFIKQNVLGKRGADFCEELFTEKVVRIAGGGKILSLCAISYDIGAFRYNIRIEPYFASEGDDLYFGAHGHQNFKSGDSLTDKLSNLQEFVEHMQEFLLRIVEEAGE